MNVLDTLQNVNIARGAAQPIFSLIVQCEKACNEGTKDLSEPARSEEKGATVSLKDVTFAFPSNPEKNILTKFSLDVESGQSVALVGPSGCGKSTIMQLLLRFYKLKHTKLGTVFFNGIDVNKLDPVLYRQDIALVEREPPLFDMSIAQNIAFGVSGIADQEEASMEEIVEAAKQANTHNFITKFPNGYETIVGADGGFLSGGQKQRIAIARAII